MSEQEEKQLRIFYLLNAGTKPKEISEFFEFSLWSPLSPDLKPLDYALWGVLENKTNTTSHPNIGLLNTAFEEEWIKMSEEFFLKKRKSFRRCFDTMIKKKMVAILSKFTVLCLSYYFVAYFFKLELILLYNRVVFFFHIRKYS